MTYYFTSTLEFPRTANHRNKEGVSPTGRHQALQHQQNEEFPNHFALLYRGREQSRDEVGVPSSKNAQT